MNDFEKTIVEKFGKDNFKKLQSVKIGIAGCGGLGSNCAFNLVRTGFKKFKIVDYDRIDHSNLNRQFYFFDQIGANKPEALKDNLLRINPDLEIDAVIEKVDAGNTKKIFDDCDIIVEAFDKTEYKSMLVESLLETDKFIVCASGLAGFGRCDEIKVHRMKENLVVVGDMESDIKDKPPLSPRVNVAAAKQADVILEYVITNNKG